VLSANQFLRRDGMPAELHTDDMGPVLINGGSVIVSPLGDVLAGPLRDCEGILTAELDLDDLPRARFDFDAVGHYARPDVFSLHVDESARNAVTGLS
jgi:predicted amidohydrolase